MSRDPFDDPFFKNAKKAFNEDPFFNQTHTKNETPNTTAPLFTTLFSITFGLLGTMLKKGWKIFIPFYLLGLLVASILWPYSINVWIAIAGGTAVATWGHGLLLGLLPPLIPLSIPAALISLVASLIFL